MTKKKQWKKLTKLYFKNMSKEIVKGYKAFEKGLVCRGFQYELGKDFYHKGKPFLCQSGFHFCKNLGDVYSYYAYNNENTVVCEIETEGEVIDEEDGDKSVTNHIRLVRMLNAEQASNNNGIKNIGHSNTGHSNTGDWNTGDRNTGDSNTGDRNTGDRNTGDSNTGDRNTGDWNTGDWNTGHSNTGDWNTGHSNTGDWNTGDWNTTNFNTGSFNTEKITDVLVFNKMCSKKEWDDATKPNCLYFYVNEWVDFEDMTNKEKEQYGTAKFTGGFMRKLDYKKAFTASMEKASKEEIELVKKLPNFDAKVFQAISGFKIK
jgi:hypothetical protein